MNEHQSQDLRPIESHAPGEDSVVVLAIPRHVVKFGAILLSLVIVSVVSVMGVYSVLDNRAANESSGYPLPSPVTFIPPTPRLQISEDRFDVSPDDDPALGPVDAPVVIIEFSDYQCQYCGVFARERLHPLLELYPGKIRFVYRDFVFYGPLSLQAAVSAECANEQGAFWAYHDRLFEQQDNLNAKLFFALAEELELDVQAFARCASDPAVEDEVKADTADGRALEIKGTPTFYINGRILVGAQSLGAFFNIIEEELALARSKASDSSLQDTPDGS